MAAALNAYYTVHRTVHLLYLGMEPLEPLFSWRFGQYAIYGDLGSKVKGRTVPYTVRCTVRDYAIFGRSLCHIWGFYPKWPRTSFWYTTKIEGSLELGELLGWLVAGYSTFLL